MAAESKKGSKEIVLSRNVYQELLHVRKKIETRFKVSICVPPSFPTKPSDLFVVGFSGDENDVIAAMLFCNTYVFDHTSCSLKYPERLELVFANCNWISVLEELHDVIIVNGRPTNTITVFGAKVKLVISILNSLISSLGFRLRPTDLLCFQHVRKIVEESSFVPNIIKEECSKAVSALPLSSALILLSWVETYHELKKAASLNVVTVADSSMNDSVIIVDDKDQSIEVLEQPEKEIPVVTLSDDDDDGSSRSEPERTDNSSHGSSFTSSEEKFPNSSSARSSGHSSVSWHQKCEERDDGAAMQKLRKRKYSVVHKTLQNMKKKKSKTNRRAVRNKHRFHETERKELPTNDNSTHCQPKQKNLQITEFHPPPKLRPIIIDGSNVAIAHGTPSKVFSCKGIEICVKYFLKRGHKDVTAFVPQYRRRATLKGTVGQEILEELASSQLVVFTPSRCLNGKSYSSYDDRFIVKLACAKNGIIVSNDNFRDLLNEKEEWRETIEKRLLMYCFVGDIFMIPDDPLGKDGPNIEEFLCFPTDNSSN